MKYKIVYDSPGRIRVRCGSDAFKKTQEQSLENTLACQANIISAKACSVNGSILIHYSGENKEFVLNKIKQLDSSQLTDAAISAISKIDEDFKRNLFKIILKSVLTKLFMPSFLKMPVTVFRSVHYIHKGLSSLLNCQLSVDVLDAVSISASIATGSYSTAASVMTLLNISTLLEGYTRQRTNNALSESISFNIDKVWKIEEGSAQYIPLKDVLVGDILRVQQGSMIPVDGRVAEGEAEVNESAMTGEAMPSHKSEGSTVYAGTVIEQGSIDICVQNMPDESRISKVIEMIESSESLKSAVQTKAEKFADSLVPFSLITCIGTYFLTRNITKALSVLMVDYSCAIKLSTPICVISAMREAANHEIMVKGGRFLENYAFADTIVFDKTGTLTVSCPKLSKIIAFEEYSEDEVLKISACLEEHFPHSVAKSIVHAAQIRNLQHLEEHAEVEYIVAHGIASRLHDKRALIGSAHFIFDHENIKITEQQQEIINEMGEAYSMVYLAIGEKLAGVLCIEDPIRSDAAYVIKELKNKGFTELMMITGDGEETARNVCAQLGIEKFHARVLPEDKLNIINSMKTDTRKVVMVGDGINDSPALAAADVSIAMKDASDIAREISDITLLSSELDRLLLLRDLSENLFKRIHHNYWFITVFNTGLLLLGMGGVIAPATSALMHNLSTMAICAESMKPFLKEE